MVVQVKSEIKSGEPGDCRAWMSALIDGEADDVSRACALWASDAQARDAWHTYHLIGDALRSDDLAVPAAHDAAFMAAIRQRLAQEPTVLAPAPVTSAVRPAAARRWMAPVAAAAGVAMVAGVLVVARPLAPGLGGTATATLASASAPMVAGLMPVANQAGRPVQALAAAPGGVRLIRDTRLDAYLRAHRGGAAAVPGAGASGHFETVVLER